MRRRSFSLCLLAVLLCSAAGHINAQPVATTAELAPATLQVSGRAKVSRKPDYVDISVGISHEAKTASLAQSGAASTMEKMSTAIRALSLPGLELQTSHVDLSPRYHESKEGSPDVLRGYEASIGVRVRTTELTAVPKVLDAALAAGANRISSVDFGIREAIAAREEALRLAAQAASRKANVLASTLAVRLAKLQSISESSGRHHYGYMSNFAQSAGPSTGGSGDEGSSIEPGQIEVWGEVDLTYHIAPEK
jgi:hypothetical protein